MDTTDIQKQEEEEKKRPAAEEEEQGERKLNFIEDFFLELYKLTAFGGKFVRSLFIRPFEWNELARQAYFVGNKSLPLTAITAFIMGVVLTAQSRPTLAEFGAESWLPAMVSISIIREIGPVITALIFAGKVGSGIGAELASMNVTEQIEAMEVSGAKPYKYLVVTRVLSTTLMLPLLVVIGDAISLYGSYVAVNLTGHVDYRLFLSQVFEKMDFADVVPAVIKTFFFGFAIGLVGCYKGYNSDKGTEGVGKAANSAVVLASLLIFVIDMLAVELTAMFTNH